MPHTLVVREALAGLRCPVYSDSVWIGPFEQLAGAAYALLQAERHGYSRRDQRRYQYHTHVRESVAAWILEEAAPSADRLAYDDWLSAFYFNSALQRLHAASERLLAVLAGLPCGCRVGRPPARQASFRLLRERCSELVGHLASRHELKLDAVATVLEQLRQESLHEFAFAGDKVLAMIRYEVSRRQNALRPGAATEEPLRRPRGRRPTWSTAGPERRMQAAAAAFALLACAYNQLAGWQPAAREASCLALGATA